MKTIVAAMAALLFLVPVFSMAQIITTPYWCGWGWSSTPCASSAGSYWYPYVYPYPYSYPYYPYYPHHSYPYDSYYAYPRPSCTLIASSGSYDGSYHSGNRRYPRPITLSWSSSNATSAYITGIGAVGTYGSITVYPQGSMTYTMTVYGPGGTNTCQASYHQPFYQYPYPQPYYPSYY